MTPAFHAQTLQPLPAPIADAIDGLDVLAVWRRIGPALRPARLLRLAALDALTGSRITLVDETGQHTGSFKLRAALAVASHTDAPRLLTASSGNFGAALAWSAAHADKGCTVVMPKRSAQVKIDAVRRLGATVDLVDTDLRSREDRLRELALTMPEARVASPYDDPYVICGNASLGAELFAAGSPELVVTPVGGGGLASGLVLAAAGLRPGCAVVGAEPLLANDAARSLRAGELLANEGESATLCDGARTHSLGRRNFAILRHGLREIVEVSEAHVGEAVALLHRLAGIRVEPTGALALAAMLSAPERFRGRDTACVLSGGNVDSAVFDTLVG